MQTTLMFLQFQWSAFSSLNNSELYRHTVSICITSNISLTNTFLSLLFHHSLTPVQYQRTRQNKAKRNCQWGIGHNKRGQNIIRICLNDPCIKSTLFIPKFPRFHLSSLEYFPVYCSCLVKSSCLNRVY